MMFYAGDGFADLNNNKQRADVKISPLFLSTYFLALTS
jgi:hypothetical protein